MELLKFLSMETAVSISLTPEATVQHISFIRQKQINTIQHRCLWVTSKTPTIVKNAIVMFVMILHQHALNGARIAMVSHFRCMFVGYFRTIMNSLFYMCLADVQLLEAIQSGMPHGQRRNVHRRRWTINRHFQPLPLPLPLPLLQLLQVLGLLLRLRSVVVNRPLSLHPIAVAWEWEVLDLPFLTSSPPFSSPCPPCPPCSPCPPPSYASYASYGGTERCKNGGFLPISERRFWHAISKYGRLRYAESNHEWSNYYGCTHTGPHHHHHHWGWWHYPHLRHCNLIIYTSSIFVNKLKWDAKG